MSSPDLDLLQSLPHEMFERWVAALLKAKGFTNVVSLGGPGDEGIDLRAEWLVELPTGRKQMTVWAVQCKRYSRTLSQGDVQDVMNAALEPPLDLFPAPPDYFLLATSSRLSANALKLLGRANLNRSKYGCRFEFWDGNELAEAALDHPELRTMLSQAGHQEPDAEAEGTDLHLVVLVDEFPDRVFLTFLFDSGLRSAGALLERIELTPSKFADLGHQVAQLTRGGFMGDLARERLEAIGSEIASILPEQIRTILFSGGGGHLRITSNRHLIPFELGWDDQSNRFLSDIFRIGRVQAAQMLPVLKWSEQPEVLLIGPEYDQGMGPLRTQGELVRLQELLAASGLSITTAAGTTVDKTSVEGALRKKQHRIIHIAGHGLAERGMPFQFVLTDGPHDLSDLIAPHSDGALVFLNASSTTGAFVDFFERVLAHGVVAVVGFVGPVSDRGAVTLAVGFYRALLNGASLGAAVQTARMELRSSHREDYSWASFVLFGEPTVVLAPAPR